MKKYAILLLTVLAISCKPKDTSFENDNKVDITSFNKLPIIEGTINGKKAFFILDSGASISVLDINQKATYGFLIEESDDQAAGYGGNANFFSASKVLLKIGGVNFYTSFKAQDLSSIVKAVKTGEGIQIAGIVGSDIMKPNKFILDFSNNSISLGQ